jgi:hypoxia up-regulated 1
LELLLFDFLMRLHSHRAVVAAASFCLWTCLASFSGTVEGRAILGVDLGSLYMKVALVQSGSPLEIVTNLHAKRKTEQMILFDQQQRFYGADASALLARKSTKTPSAMSVLLGRDEQHPTVRVLAERHYPVRPVYNETRAGVTLTVDGVEFTPEELVAMVLSHAVDISVAYATEQGSTIAPPKDVMLTVPSYATQPERQALLDAAGLAELNVLGLIDENTASALHYAMDKSFETPQLIIFYNMGASALQVSLIRFFNYEQPQKFGKPKTVPALEVLGKSWDATLGGQAFDQIVVEYLADEFNKAWHASTGKTDQDVRSSPRAMIKLRLQANKVKHVLSANSEIPVYMEAVHDDVALSTTMTREQLESLASSLWARAIQPVTDVLQQANVTLEELTILELLGGGMRVPRIQTELIENGLGGNAALLGKHINSDESMALGAAFAGANISTAFRVRQVGMTDLNPFALSVTLTNLPDGDDTASEASNDEWSKKATIFKAFGKVGVKKTIAFTHDTDVHCALDYDTDDEASVLPAGSQTALERYRISGVVAFAKEMADKGLGKPKLSLQFELSASGITALVKAEAAVEETYTVEEEVEVEDDGVTNTTEDESEEEKKNNTEADGENKTDDSYEVKKEKKTIKVQKEKKRLHKKELTVDTYHVGRVTPYSAELLAASKAKLLEMARNDKERMMLEEAKNRVESYIYYIKNKLTDDEEEIGTVSIKEQREECQKAAEAAEEWLYDDGYSADLATMEDKYAELSAPFEKIMLRVKETAARPEAVKVLEKKLEEVEALIKKWETSMPQVTEEERTKVLDQVEEVRKWIAKVEGMQAKKKPHDEPAFVSADVPLQAKDLELMVVRLSKKPKPKPPKKKKDDKKPGNSTDAMEDTEDPAAVNKTEANSSESAENKSEAEGAQSNETLSEPTSGDAGMDEEL